MNFIRLGYPTRILSVLISITFLASTIESATAGNKKLKRAIAIGVIVGIGAAIVAKSQKANSKKKRKIRSRLKVRRAAQATNPQNSEVLNIQQALANRGFDPGAVDGLMGGKTKTAIKQFQQSLGSQQTGRLSSTQRQTLLASTTTTASNTQSVIPVAKLPSTYHLTKITPRERLFRCDRAAKFMGGVAGCSSFISYAAAGNEITYQLGFPRIQNRLIRVYDFADKPIPAQFISEDRVCGYHFLPQPQFDNSYGGHITATIYCDGGRVVRDIVVVVPKSDEAQYELLKRRADTLALHGLNVGAKNISDSLKGRKTP